jgi:methionine synthase II (cobalamin-independent)
MAKNTNNDNQTNDLGKSLTAAIEEIAKLLRTEVKITTNFKMKQRQAKLLSLEALGPSMSNNIQQVARLLRTQTQQAKRTISKRTYTIRSKHKVKSSKIPKTPTQ